jgi:hypothetical protein
VRAVSGIRRTGPRAQEASRTMDYDSDEERMSIAEQMAGHDPRGAADALSAIACDAAVGDEVRLAAAEQLAAIDPRAVAEACLSIACDAAVGDEVRLAAAELLAAVSPRAATQTDRPR